MRQVLSLSPFDADPAVVFFDVDLDGGEAGTVENGFKGFRCRVIEVVVFDVFLDFSAEAVVAVDFGDEQEGATWFQDAAYFFQVFWWIRPEIEAFDGRILSKVLSAKGRASTEPSQTVIFPAAMSAAFVWHEVWTDVGE